MLPFPLPLTLYFVAAGAIAVVAVFRRRRSGIPPLLIILKTSKSYKIWYTQSNIGVENVAWLVRYLLLVVLIFCRFISHKNNLFGNLSKFSTEISPKSHSLYKKK